MLSQKQLNDICLIGQGSKQCRFLDINSCHCLKLTNDRQRIDNSVDKYLLKMKTRNPYDEGFPLGNNCQGYPILQHVIQGYDINS